MAATASLTVLFVTHNVREAVRLGRPRSCCCRAGRAGSSAEFDVDIERPRRIDSPEVSALAAEITDRSARGGAPPCPTAEALTPSAAVDAGLDEELAGLDALERARP